MVDPRSRVLCVRLLRTTGFRLAALGAGLAALAAIVAFAIIYYGTVGAMAQTLDVEIGNELVEIVDPGAHPTSADLVGAVRDSLTEPGSGTFFALIDPAGHILEANLAHPPRAVGWTWRKAPRDAPFAHHVRTLRGLGVRLADGGLLFVGENATALAELKELIVRAFVVAFGLTLVIGLAAGIAVGHRAVGRVAAINATLARIMAGDLARRLERSPLGDEVDDLASGVNAMLDRIQALMDDLRLVGNEIAHDLRSPLARLRGSLELALVKGGEPELRTALGQAIAQTDEILTTFGALLRLARIESGARRAAFGPVDLSALLDALIETYEPVAEEAGCSFETAIARGLGVRGDAALLNQLFANLIENALKHGPPEGAIAVQADVEGGRAVVRIRDRGPGIPPERRSEAMRRFGRLDPARGTAGAGLGLPIAAAIAELHSGTLALADSAPGVSAPGLLVVVSLPLAAGHAAASRGHAHALTRPART
jgi:signal transduction histidine kinase